MTLPLFAMFGLGFAEIAICAACLLVPLVLITGGVILYGSMTKK